MDTVTQQVYQFDDDVVVTNKDGMNSFETALGVPLGVPTTLQPYTIPQPMAAQIGAQQASVAWAAYQVSARAALVESDKTILRCYENAVAVPTTWAAYRKTLRTIISAASGDPTVALPMKSAYPAGT